MFVVFVLFYWNVYRKRHALALSDALVFEARAGMRTHAISVGVGTLSIVLALTLPLRLIWLAGFVYALQGPLHAVNGRLIGKARARAFPSSTPTRR